MSAKHHVVVLVADGYQELEFWYPLLRLREERIAVDVVGLEEDRTYLSRLGYPVIPDHAVSSVSASGYTGVVVPGGSAGSAIARTPELVRFVADAAASGAVVGVVSQAAEVLDAARITATAHVAGRDADDLPSFFNRFMNALTEAAR
ncbi:DJ-1/PfpI family protein [Azospirillum rugosum]|uniref:Protease I n=1 Tax=Azospirillum rugosum TaxID=416170 RepID=A0ABS4SW59_9PROT|nr:DJ-1/PfpI family protein [Azospirillum rugosum]MBP2296789.1 protease I [Azospirillum rugosum]MDQ0530392.1 protease I [Azospirillum rugosum]